MLLFILESIGTSELILIGIIALIFLGPRKLPQIARTIGKTMADFRSTTNEFKSTWEREVNFEEEAKALRTGDLPRDEPSTVARTHSIGESATHSIAAPSIKPAQPELFTNSPVGDDHLNEADENHQEDKVDVQTDETSDKRNWL